MRSSFVRKGTVASAPDPGTRPGLYGQTLVSSGHGDLDQLLGGGLPLGSLTLVLEDGWSGHHATLLRYFLAEGAACGQSLLLAAAEPPEGGLAGFVPQQLPGRPEREEEEEERRRAAAGSEQVELRIAWQYRRYMKGASQGPQAQQDQQRQRRDGVAGAAGMGPAAVQPRQGQAGRQPARPRGAAAGLRGWCHKFDLTRGTGEEGLQACHARLAQCSGRDALVQLAGATLAPDSASVAGLLHLRKLPALGTAAPPAPDVALHLLRHRRRRLSISPVEVDPDAEAAAAEGKQQHGTNKVVLSAEPGNLLNVHSYKFSGLANLASTVDVAPAEKGVTIGVSSKKSKAGKLARTVVKKNARRTNVAAGAVAGSVRPDLKRAAQARASALTKAARAAKAAAASA
eukprot:scaffold9.g3209.t1